jgi:DNA-binding transcriptional LysR family regulator
VGDEPELRELRYFVAVAEELSFTRAAARLHLSQQSLSQAIAALERRVGAALLVRTTRSVTLTGPGAVMLTEARAVLAAADSAMTRVRAAVGRLQGRLRLGCSFDLHHVLTPVLHTIRAHQPDLDVEIGLGTQQALLTDLAAQRIDAALTWRRPVGSKGVRGAQILVAPLLAVVRNDDPLTRLDPPLTRRQLRVRPLIIHHRRAAPGPYDEMIEQFYEGADVGPLHYIDVLASGHEARLHALRTGQGIALLADFAHRALDTTGTTVLSVHPPLQVTVELLWPEQAGSSTRAALQYLAALLRGSGQQ